jgi:exosortase
VSSVPAASTLAATARRSAPRPDPPRPELVDMLLRRDTLVMLVIILAGVVALFWRWFLAQHEKSWGNGDWSHAYMVPLISGYLIWQNRRAIERAEFTVYWPGLIPMLMGIWTYVYFIAGIPNHLGQGLALVLVIFGLTLLLLGPRAMEHCFTAIAFLVFGITVPEMIMNLLTYPLQDLAASAGYFILRLFGVNSDLSGNAITVYDLKTGSPIPLTIAEQCSGMRTVIAFVALGVVVALVGTRQWWKRVVLVGLAPVVAVILNAIRIATLGYLSQYNPKFSEGEAHMLIGTLLLVPGFLFYLGVLWALNQAAPEAAEQSDSKPRKPSGPSGGGSPTVKPS